MKRLSIAIAFVLMTAASVQAAQTDRAAFQSFPMVSLTRGQTARINVVLVANNDPNQVGAYVPGFWIETFFISGDGRVLSRSEPRALQVGIAYGHEMQACPSDSGNIVGCTGVERAQIRAVVRMFGDVNKTLAEASVVSSVEVLSGDVNGDRTTQVLLLPAINGGVR